MIKEIAGNKAVTHLNDVKIEGVDNQSLNRLAEILDITASGATHRKRMGGLQDSSLSLSGNYLPTDVGQLDLIPGEIVPIKHYPAGVGQPGGKSMDMIVESFEESADVGGKVTFSVSLSGVSPVTKIV